jgi:hypothetical protein
MNKISQVKLSRLPFILCLLAAGLLSGCATYYPLKNEKILTAVPIRKVFVMPFEVNINTFLGGMNTRAKFEEKTKAARGMVIEALKEKLPEFGCSVAGQVSLEEYDKKGFDEEHKRLIDGIYAEYIHGKNSIGRNLNEEKGKLSEYSLGIRTKELMRRLDSPAGTLLFVAAAGYVANLTALEDNGMNVVSAILTLGLSKLIPAPDDSIYIELTFVDVATGEIYWVNYYNTAGGQSYLVDDHIKRSVQEVLKPLNKK